MAYRAYLQRGSNKLYLDAAPYELAQGFVPPAISEIPNIASGTSANQYGGGKLIDKRADSAPYSFSVRVMGNSNGHNEALVDRLDRFVRSGTEAEPVYFCWRPADNVDFEPLYGQWNATRRAKVITGSVYKSAAFYGENIRTVVMFADVNLIVNPPEGKRQRVATATGGIIEDTIGTQDGTSRGVIVAEATTNVITNPIHGNATALTNWTVGSDTIGEVVTDGDFVLFGSNAVRLTRKTSGSTFSFYESINVGNTNTWCLSCYVKKPDSSAVTSSDIQLRYGGTTSAPSFMAVGNGWYRAWKTFTGIASSQVVGCTPIVSGGVVYVTGFQLEEKAYPTPLAYGSLLGCAWSSTAHASSTTRTVSSLRIPASECIASNEFTWWIAFRANCTFSEFASTRVLMKEDATNAYLAAETTGQLSFTYNGSNGCNGAATAITAGQVVIIHATMNAAGMQIYRNGAADGAGTATYAPLASPTYLYVGSTETPGNHSNATILGAGTYNRSMTAAEVAADYANLYQAAIGLDTYGARVDWIPYLWTKDGDDVVDNCNDATRDNWCMVASVPGSLASNTEFLITPTTPYGTYYLALNPVSTYIDPTTQTYKDASGTAEATASGGEVQEMVSSYGFAYYIPANPSEFTGKIHFLARALHNTGSNNSANGAISYTNALSSSISAARTTPILCPNDTTYNLYYLGHINWQYDAKALSSVRAAYEHGVGQQKLDYFMAIPGYLVRIDDPIGTIASFYISGTKIYGATTAYLVLRLTGDVIEVVPGKLNMLYFLMGTDTAENLVTDTATFTSVYITPRWALA